MWKFNKYRIIYIIIVILTIVAGWKCNGYILKEDTPLDIFTYSTSVITIIALIIAIGEILHSSFYTKSVYELTNEKVDAFKEKTSSEFKLECFNYYLSIIEKLDDELYSDAYSLFKSVKKLDDYLYINHADDKNGSYKDYPSNLLKIEKKIFSLRTAVKGSGLNKEQRKALINQIFSHRTSLASLIADK